MSADSSRRDFFLKLPAAGLAASVLGGAAPPAGAIVQRTLGRTGLKVTPLAFGGNISDPTLATRAADMGINYFDTARIYSQGNSERLMGVGLKGIRNKVVLVSKTVAKKAADALADLDKSLQELQTDHLDVWYLHARDTVDAIPDELIEAQEKAKQQGKTRFIGVSTHDPNAIVDHVLKVGKHDVVFITYNFAMGTSRDAAIAKLKAANIGLVAMKTTTPSGGPTAPPPGGRGGRCLEGAPPPVRKPGAHLAGLKWAMKNPAIATCVVTMMDTDVLEENFKAITEPLTPGDERLLVAINEDIRPSYCRMCFECKGQCPQGVPVPNVLRYLAYADFNGDFLMGRQNFLELPKSVQQVRCGECESCSVKCPNGVKVQARLMRAQDMFA